jgi:hypothetical protein
VNPRYVCGATCTGAVAYATVVGARRLAGGQGGGEGITGRVRLCAVATKDRLRPGCTQLCAGLFTRAPEVSLVPDHYGAGVAKAPRHHRNHIIMVAELWGTDEVPKRRLQVQHQLQVLLLPRRQVHAVQLSHVLKLLLVPGREATYDLWRN